MEREDGEQASMIRSLNRHDTTHGPMLRVSAAKVDLETGVKVTLQDIRLITRDNFSELKPQTFQLDDVTRLALQRPDALKLALDQKEIELPLKNPELKEDRKPNKIWLYADIEAPEGKAQIAICKDGANEGTLCLLVGRQRRPITGARYDEGKLYLTYWESLNRESTRHLLIREEEFTLTKTVVDSGIIHVHSKESTRLESSLGEAVQQALKGDGSRSSSGMESLVRGDRRTRPIADGSPEDWAYVTGLFNGEGSVYQTRRKGRTFPVVKITMCSRDAVEPVAKLWNVQAHKTIKGICPQTPDNPLGQMWTVSREGRAAYQVLQRMNQTGRLSQEKRQKAEKVGCPLQAFDG